eukprot:TRINITY_DN1588_c0_g4_i3.p1 TRINITY_DN1588_c0_g4~~TRINITY_DN1588_c0_g4_i3.p1  ORF type:complete len:295 (-),score=73.69 TRINITY_DN1588_c0_g4_i3:37-921(-)
MEKLEPETTKQVEEKIKFYEWSESRTQLAESIITADSKPVTQFWYEKYEKEARKNWDIFYKNNTTNFFKDRHYIDREFFESLDIRLEKGAQALESGQEIPKEPRKILWEVGCGVGNTIFPLSKKYREVLKVFGFDFSPRAIEMIRKSPEYNPEDIVVETCDLVLDPIPPSFDAPDFVTLVFVLSAISPENHEGALQKLSERIKPGALLFFRDYGRYDMAQLKLAEHKSAKLRDHFYVKSDGTRVYYFTTEEIESLFVKVGFEKIKNEYHYRLVENKKEKLEMHRVWIQSIFRKL